MSGAVVPVTLLSGFLGSGKTSLIAHVLSGGDDGDGARGGRPLRVGVIVNDLAEVRDGAFLGARHTQR